MKTLGKKRLDQVKCIYSTKCDGKCLKNLLFGHFHLHTRNQQIQLDFIFKKNLMPHNTCVIHSGNKLTVSNKIQVYKVFILNE